ncbi:hypothetical protein LC087_10005 [Bacillus carboniphilus]|uniref:GPI inositol-deacylase PGAP1-like alpha/beta domain-containing protein n=1 Tax=Bacillus carboniphilus TaxID=86663 RepID=A0ABY9JUC5_9BACI|nr:hypothetical protein [Bacillus carboniphilus]WLR41270.1 hypothetical protein LC087_10005 [Bacillus carboniphilus]
MRRKLLLLLVFVMFIPQVAEAGKFFPGETSTPGEWFLGDIPTEIDYSKAPLVFVHGLNSSAETWTDDNDMDEMVYENGYESAYINLYPEEDMWDNGKLLKEKLEEIYDHFGRKVILVTHSKGGIDSQAALVHEGADEYVEKVITLSTPHYGSQLADLAYSSWASWLTSIIGSKSDALYSLQTSYMSYFREQTDSDPDSQSTPIYTFGGKDWGSFGGYLFWGGLYLSSYGKNDGAVTVKSSRLPYSTEISVGNWDHSTIKTGSATFNLFESYLTSSNANQNSLTTSSTLSKQNTFNLVQNYNSSFTTNVSLDEEKTTANSIFRGGEYIGKQKETFFVDETTTSINLDWMSAYEDTKITLISPSKKVYKNVQTSLDVDSVFKGAYHHKITVNKPEVGKWTVKAKQPNKKDGYFLQISFDSDLNDDLEIEKKKTTKNKVQMKQQVKHIKKNSLSTDVTIQYSENGEKKEEKLSSTNIKDLSDIPLQNKGEGIYHISMEIEGNTERNNKFERSLLYTIYIDDKGKVHQK